jgi:hypothetical protein
LRQIIVPELALTVLIPSCDRSHVATWNRARRYVTQLFSPIPLPELLSSACSVLWSSQQSTSLLVVFQRVPVCVTSTAELRSICFEFESVLARPGTFGRELDVASYFDRVLPARPLFATSSCGSWGGTQNRQRALLRSNPRHLERVAGVMPKLQLWALLDEAPFFALQAYKKTDDRMANATTCNRRSISTILVGDLLVPHQS